MNLDDFLYPKAARRLICWGSLLVSCGLVYLVSLHPGFFSRHARENGVVENLSALFLIAGSAAAATAALFQSKKKDWFTFWLALVLSVVLFVIAMEEISWGQHWFGFAIPEIASRNAQQETNLHNFATNFFEALYYAAAWCLTVLLPWLGMRFSRLKDLHRMGHFSSSVVLCLGVITAAYNDNIHYFFWTQLFYGWTALILLDRLIAAWRQKKGRPLYFCLLIHLVAAQFQFYLCRSALARKWDVTEYKEFFIALSLCVAAFELLKVRLKGAAPDFD